MFTAPNGSGCVRTGDQGHANGVVLGSFAVPGETDCLELDSTPGATIGVTLPPWVTGAARPEWTLINADGTDLCSNGCTLAGPAPYRILLNAPDDSGPGEYRLVVQRLDRVDGCATLPQAAIGSSAGAVTTFAANRFTTCYRSPANQHSSEETIGYAPVSGPDGWANIGVHDDRGDQVCGSGRWASAQLVTCRFETGRAYTVLLTAAATDFQYRISRKDTTDAAGKHLCPGYVVPCRVRGSTSYQIFVWPAVDGQTVPYRVDTWRLTIGGQPVAQCPAVNGAPAFGPIIGTLSDQRTAVCVSVPVNYRSAFKAQITNTGGGDRDTRAVLLPDPDRRRDQHLLVGRRRSRMPGQPAVRRSVRDGAVRARTGDPERGSPVPG